VYCASVYISAIRIHQLLSGSGMSGCERFREEQRRIGRTHNGITSPDEHPKRNYITITRIGSAFRCMPLSPRRGAACCVTGYWSLPSRVPAVASSRCHLSICVPSVPSGRMLHPVCALPTHFFYKRRPPPIFRRFAAGSGVRISPLQLLSIPFT